MPRRNRRRATARAPARRSTDDPAIDALYGLDAPIGFPESDSAGVEAGQAGLHATHVDCPYCGERFETVVDPSAGSAAYIEDCQVCCQPIELSVQVDEHGAVAAVSAARSD
jgi:hypothetical protein